MIEYCKKLNIVTNVITNGTLIDYGLIKKILEVGLDNISFSIDAATKSTYERIRMGGSFEQVITNIKHFVAKNVNNKINISINYTAMEENLNEIPAFIELAEKLGVKNVKIHDLQETVSPINDVPLRRLNEKKVNQILKIAHGKAEKYGINLSAECAYKRDNSTTNCKQPWRLICIMASGLVRPCIGSYENFGNVFQRPINQIWNSYQFINWRKRVRNNDPPQECLICRFA